jgi:hypothetical protein
VSRMKELPGSSFPNFAVLNGFAFDLQNVVSSHLEKAAKHNLMP